MNLSEVEWSLVKLIKCRQMMTLPYYYSYYIYKYNNEKSFEKSFEKVLTNKNIRVII